MPRYGGKGMQIPADSAAQVHDRSIDGREPAGSVPCGQLTAGLLQPRPREQHGLRVVELPPGSVAQLCLFGRCRREVRGPAVAEELGRAQAARSGGRDELGCRDELSGLCRRQRRSPASG